MSKSLRMRRELGLRAWAVREGFVFAGILFYRAFELRWDCLESHGSESLPREPYKNRDPGTDVSYQDLAKYHVPGENPVGRHRRNLLFD